MAVKILAATAFPGEAAAYSGIIPEGYELHCVEDGGSALSFVRMYAPRFVIADAALPVADGYSLAAMIRRLDVPVIPGIIIACISGMERRTALSGVVTLTKPLTQEGLIDALGRTDAGNRTPDPAMLECTELWLRELGVPQHPGRDYLREAAFLAHEDLTLLDGLTTRLYPMVAARYGVKSQAVERAMRHVIENAWSSGNIESQYAIFKNTIDAARDKPTCGGMIAQLAHMLRREVF